MVYTRSMEHLDLILTLTGGLVAALFCGYATQRLGLSPIVGYLLAGVAVGPHTPGFEANHELAEQLAEIGVILLMFGVGLQFHWEDLLATRKIAVTGALGQSLIATLLGAVATVALGGTVVSGLVFGLALSVASTVVLARVLSDQRELHTPTGRIAIGWLVVEDIFTVVMLVLLPTLLRGPADVWQITGALVWTGVRIGVLVAFTIIIGGRVIPALLEHMARIGSRELFTLTILALALGIAVGSAQVFGVSMALGAFLAGMVVGRSEFSLRAATEALPMRDAFAVLFFVSVGMLFDPFAVWAAPGWFVATLAIVMLGKPLAAWAIIWWMQYPPRVALGVAAALAQIGEFSFILAALGAEWDLISPAASSGLIATAIVSITLNPLLFQGVRRFEDWAARRPAIWRFLTLRSIQLPADAAAVPADPLVERQRAVVIGYGPVGRTVTRLLRENGLEAVVIDLNLDTCRQLREAGIPAVYGDARLKATLQEAGIERAGSLILSSAGQPGCKEVLQTARELNPRLRMLARTAYISEMAELQAAGADTVYSGEGEVGLAFLLALLRGLGATADQIDRERDRAHADLFGTQPRADRWAPPAEG